MSFKLNNAVQKLKPLSGHAVRLILWYLADHANDDGVAYASYETLMRACQIKSRTTINQGIQELEGLGILETVNRPNQCLKYILSMTGIKLRMMSNICFAPGCSYEGKQVKEGLQLCDLCAEAYPKHAPHIQPSGSTLYDTPYDSPEVNLGEPRVVGSTVGDTAGSTLLEVDSTLHDTPGSTFSEVGSTVGDTLSFCSFPLETNPPDNIPTVAIKNNLSSKDQGDPETPKDNSQVKDQTSDTPSQGISISAVEESFQQKSTPRVAPPSDWHPTEIKKATKEARERQLDKAFDDDLNLPDDVLKKYLPAGAKL